MSRSLLTGFSPGLPLLPIGVLGGMLLFGLCKPRFVTVLLHDAKAISEIDLCLCIVDAGFFRCHTMYLHYVLQGFLAYDKGVSRTANDVIATHNDVVAHFQGVLHLTAVRSIRSAAAHRPSFVQ